MYLLEDLGDDNILCRYPKADLKPLRDLSFVKQVDVYRNVYKIPETLQALAKEGDNATEVYPIDVMVHDDVKGEYDSEQYFHSLVAFFTGHNCFGNQNRPFDTSYGG